MSARGTVPIDPYPRVLEGSRPPLSNVAYIDQVVGEGTVSAEFQYFAGMLQQQTGDVVHLHQVESLLGRGSSGAMRLRTARGFVKRLAKEHITLVQTIFVERPGSDPRHLRAYDVLDAATAVFVVLDETTPTPVAERTVVIPHMHYRERFLGYPRKDPVQGRLLALAAGGLGRSAGPMLRLFPLLDSPEPTLRVAGVVDNELAALLARTSLRALDRISVRDETLSDGAMVEEVTAAELVILPAVESLADMSLLMLVLSLDRPVVVRDDARMRALQREVGDGWMFLHRGALTAEILDAIVFESRHVGRSISPSFSAREPGDIAKAYDTLFRRVATR